MKQQPFFAQQHDKLTGLLTQLAEHRSLKEKLSPLLSPKAQQALVDAFVQGNTLYLLTTSATWASRLRLSSRQLLDACHQDDVHYVKTQIVAKMSEPTAHQFRPAEPPSTAQLQQLIELQQSLPSNDPLGKSLQRLIEQFT